MCWTTPQFATTTVLFTWQAFTTQTSTDIRVRWVQVSRTGSNPPHPDICTCFCGRCMSYEFPCKCFTFRCCPTYLNPPHPDICTCLCGKCMSYEHVNAYDIHFPQVQSHTPSSGWSKYVGKHRNVQHLHVVLHDTHFVHVQSQASVS
jgi:hypothetical protein